MHQTENDKDSLANLSYFYSLTNLYLSDLYPYELIILILYIIMIIFSFCTNSIAIIIFFVGRRSRSELTPFLLNLSFFNIIMTVYCIPFTITSVLFQRWLYARALCTVLDSLKTFSISGVLLTLIAIAIDRYCAVKYPLNVKIYSARKRNLIAIGIIWLLSLTLAGLSSPARSLPIVEKRLWVSSRTIYQQYIHSIEQLGETFESEDYKEKLSYRLVDTIQCVPNKIRRPVEVRRTVLNFLQTYFIPLSVLAFVYLRIAALLWQRTTSDNHDEFFHPNRRNLFSPESIQFKKKLKQGIKMLVAVVILYAVLWLPMNVFQLCLNLLCYQRTEYPRFCSEVTVLQLLYITAHFLSVSNTAINPIIYGFLNNCFRSDIRQLRRRLFHCQGRTPLYMQTRFTRKTPQNADGRVQFLNGQSTQRPGQGIAVHASLMRNPYRQRPPWTSPLLRSEDAASKFRHTT